MNEDFVPYELAVKLKEKGFKYNKNNLLDRLCMENQINHPSIHQVLKWLREEKEIDIVIYPVDASTVFMGGEKYILSVYISRKRDYKLHHDNKDKYVKWEEASLSGIKYVIDELI
jgi:hypothetical protein